MIIGAFEYEITDFKQSDSACKTLNQMRYKFLAVAWQEVDNRNLDHCVAAGLLLHSCAGCVHKHLTCERRVVYLHLELEKLILSLARNTLALKQNTVSHVAAVVDAGNRNHVQLIVCEIIVGFQLVVNLLSGEAILKLNVNQTAVNAGTLWHGHRESVFNAFL